MMRLGVPDTSADNTLDAAILSSSVGGVDDVIGAGRTRRLAVRALEGIHAGNPGSISAVLNNASVVRPGPDAPEAVAWQAWAASCPIPRFDRC